MVNEQQIDEVTPEAISWKNWGDPDELSNLPLALRKYRKKFNRLDVENDFLYRLFYVDCGKVKHKYFCVPNALWRELVFRLHISKTAGQFDVAETVEEVQKRYYFPNFSCLQLKTALIVYNLNAYRQILKTPLQPVSSLLSYPGETH